MFMVTGGFYFEHTDNPHKDVMAWSGTFGYRTVGRRRNSQINTNEKLHFACMSLHFTTLRPAGRNLYVSSRTRGVKERVRCGTIPI